MILPGLLKLLVTEPLTDGIGVTLALERVDILPLPNLFYELG